MSNYPDNYNRYTAPDGFIADENETDEEFQERAFGWVRYALCKMFEEVQFEKDQRDTDDWTDAILTAIDNDVISDAFRLWDLERAALAAG